MKRKNIIMIIILLVIIASGICIFVSKGNSLKLKDSSFIFEFGEKVPFKVDYYLKNKKEKILTNSKIKFKNEYLVDTSNDEIKSLDAKYLNVGTYELYIEYKDKKVYFNIEVKDTTKPEFKDFKDTIIIEQNALDVDLSKFYEATDLSNTTILVESDFDVSKVGEYKALIKATDYFGNTEEKESTIKVISYDEIKNNKLTENIDKEVYKSQKTLDEENKKEEPIVKTETQSKNTNKNNTNTNSNNTNSNTNKNTNNNTSNSSVASATYRKDISDSLVIKINNYRKENGRSELPVTSDAQAVADKRAKEIVTNPSHDGSVYSYGENIGGGGIGTDFFELWKNSFAHNNTLLREQNTAIAVSIYQVNNQWYAVAVFKLDY